METRVHRVFTGLDKTANIIAAGTTLYNLSTGAINLADREIGIFKMSNLTSVDPGTALTAQTEPVFIAMGYDSTGDGTVDSVVKSLPIDPSKIVKISKQGYTCSKDQIKRITWTSTDCETEYCLKFNVNSVQISEYLGYNPLYKTFSVTTDCCDDSCDTCGGGDCDTLADAIVTAINSDKDAFFTAAKTAQNDLTIATIADISTISTDTVTYVAGGQTFKFVLPTITNDASGRTALSNALIAELVTRRGVVPTAADIVVNGTTDVAISNAFISSLTLGDAGAMTVTAVANACPSVFVKANVTALANFCHLPVNLVKANGISFEIYGDCGWDCNLTVTDVQSLQYETGNAIVVKDMEEEASGYGKDHWYRYTSLIQPDPVRTLLTDVTENYVVYTIEHQDLHEGAPSGHYHRSTWRTILAVPTGTVNCDTQVIAESTLEGDVDTLLGT